MTAARDAIRARRYLLGEASEPECEAIEQENLADDEALDRFAEAEDDLIEDYLSGHLSAAERGRFERAYLTVPHRRIRLEAMRRLMAPATTVESPRPAKARVLSWRVRSQGTWLALAASLLLVTSIALWMFRASGTRQTDVAGPAQPVAPGPEAPPAQAPRALRTFALVLSPVAVRGGGERPAVVPPDAEVIVIRFESEVDGRTLVPARATIATVAGERLWEGPAAAEADAPAGTVARIDVPVADLPADDYIVTLYGRDRAGVEREWSRYYLNLRSR
jgi:hypothetical protein